VGRFALKVQTTPAPAFYAFLCATVLSLVLGHVASGAHRRARGETGSMLHEEAVQPVRLLSFAKSPVECVLVMASLVGAALAAVLGVFLPSFSFEVSGFATTFLFGEAVKKTYSLLSVGISVASGRYDEVGLLALEVAFVALVVLLPALLLSLLLVLWLAPLQPQLQRNLLRACRLLDAWASVDVAAVSLAVSCFEFARLAEWLVYDGNFAAPCTLIKNLTHDECLEITMHPHAGLVAVLLAGAALLVVPKVSMARLDRALRQRLRKDHLEIKKATHSEQV